MKIPTSTTLLGLLALLTSACAAGWLVLGVLLAVQGHELRLFSTSRATWFVFPRGWQIAFVNQGLVGELRSDYVVDTGKLGVIQVRRASDDALEEWPLNTIVDAVALPGIAWIDPTGAQNGLSGRSIWVPGSADVVPRLRGIAISHVLAMLVLSILPLIWGLRRWANPSKKPAPVLNYPRRRVLKSLAFISLPLLVIVLYVWIFSGAYHAMVMFRLPWQGWVIDAPLSRLRVQWFSDFVPLATGSYDRRALGMTDTEWTEIFTEGWVAPRYRSRVDGPMNLVGAGFSLPFGYLMLLTVLAPGLFLFCRVRDRTRLLLTINQGLCPKCGYDLRATRDRCPECGTTVGPVAGN